MLFNKQETDSLQEDYVVIKGNIKLYCIYSVVS